MKALLKVVVLSLAACWPLLHGDQPTAVQLTISTEWRNDEVNLEVVREPNRAYARLPFSRAYDGVSDDRKGDDS